MLRAGGVSLGVGVYSPQKGNAFKICQKWGGSLETAPVRGKLKGHVKGSFFSVLGTFSVFGIFHGAL